LLVLRFGATLFEGFALALHTFVLKMFSTFHPIAGALILLAEACLQRRLSGL